jgi:hypothetical protein
LQEALESYRLLIIIFTLLRQIFELLHPGRKFEIKSHVRPWKETVHDERWLVPDASLEERRMLVQIFLSDILMIKGRGQ